MTAFLNSDQRPPEGISINQARNSAMAYCVVSVAIVLLFGFLQAIGWVSNSSAHTSMELVATLLSMFVGTVALVRYYSQKTNTYLIVGVGFLGTALLDFSHLLVSSDWFQNALPSPPPSLISWSWSSSRTFLAFVMVASWLVWRHEQKSGKQITFNEWTVYATTGVLTIANFCFFSFVPLPTAYYPDFVLGRPQELFTAGLFLIALVGYISKHEWKSDTFEFWLVMSLVIGFLSQAVVMSRSFTLFDASFDFAHLLKIGSYATMLTGLLISMYQLLKHADESAAQQAHQANELRLEISRRKLTENSLVDSQQRLATRAEQLAATNSELEQFSFAASHDLQEPLRKIAAFCQLLKNEYGSELNDEANQYLDFAVDGAKRMKDLVSGLLDFARINACDENIENTDASMMFENAVANLETRINETNAIVTCDELPIIRADEQQITRLLQNLIGNAIKYSCDSRTPRIHVGAKKSNNDWVFSVADNGIGIESKFHEQIFEVFKRLHSKDTYSGTGIGLAICKKIIDRMAGNIWVESEAEHGSTFYFSLSSELDNSPNSTQQDMASQNFIQPELLYRG